MQLINTKFYSHSFLGLVSLLLVNACSDTEAAPEETTEAEVKSRVLVVETKAEDIVLSRSYAARTQGFKEVEVRARLEGELMSREYEEGQLVEQDALLFKVEAAPFEVAVQRSEAELQRAQAELNDAQRQWDRIRSLFEEGAVSQRERDEGQANLELAEANKAAAEASLRNAEIDLSYTEIRSPITGIASRESYSVGNLVSPGDNLTTVVQLDPLYVYFSVPEGDTATTYLLQQVSVLASEDELEQQAPSARIELPNGQTYEHEGYIDFVSRQVDGATGTLNVRARIPNPDAVVLPGQFTRVQIPDITLPDAIAIPERAIVQSGEKSVVYVVTEDNRTELRDVVLGPRSENRIVIVDGLAPNERVVVEGLAMLQAGQEVNAEPFQESETGS